MEDSPAPDASIPEGQEAPHAAVLPPSEEPAADAPARPGGSPLFKLRIGATEGVPSLTAPPTAETPVVAGSPAPVANAPFTPSAARPEEFPAITPKDVAREYKSDTEFQRMIEQLASQITDADDPGTAPVRSTAPTGRGLGASRTSPAKAAPTKPSRSDARRAAKAAAVTPTPARDVRPAAAPTAPPVRMTPVAQVPVAQVPAAPAPAAPAPVAAVPVLSPGSVVAPAAPEAALQAVETDTRIDDRVEVPAIVEAVPAAPSGPQLPVSTPSAPTGEVPKLTGLSLAAPQLLPKIEPKPGAPRPTKPVDFHSLLQVPAPTAAPSRRAKRHPFRVMFKLVLVLGILGGGAYAGKKYYLDTKWQPGLKDLADQVADRRGLSWDHAVHVETLDAHPYALHLASRMLGVDTADSTTLSGEWRAMGLVSGNADLVAIGSAATADQPAFYDPTDHTIYELAGMSSQLRELALSRAMTNALLDQREHWGDRLLDANGASVDVGVRLGVLALFDGDAMAIQSATTDAVLADPAVATAVSAELATIRLGAAQSAKGASPYAVAIAGSAGIAARSLFAAAMTPDSMSRDGAEAIAVTSDASIFDGVRGRGAKVDDPPAAAAAAPASETTVAPVPVAVTAPAALTTADPNLPSTVAPSTTLVTSAPAGATSRGMMYWYYVLAGRLDATVAWNAALRWQGDGTVLQVTPGGQCVDATIVTSTVDDEQVLLSALTDWAAAGPAEAQATVSAMNDTAIAVHSCDPGTTAATAANTAVPLFGNAPTELAVAAGMLDAGLPNTEPARTCVISTIRTVGAPPLLRSTTVDQSLTVPTLDRTAPAVRDLISTCSSK